MQTLLDPWQWLVDKAKPFARTPFAKALMVVGPIALAIGLVFLMRWHLQNVWLPLLRHQHAGFFVKGGPAQQQFFAMFLGSLGFALLAWATLLLSGGHVLTNTRLDARQRALWIASFFFLFPLGFLIYFFRQVRTEGAARTG